MLEALFSGRIRPCVRLGVRPVSTITPEWVEGFDQILHKHSVPWLDKLIRFWRSWVKVKVATRSNIWVNYCGVRRHKHRCFGVEVTSCTPCLKKLCRFVTSELTQISTDFNSFWQVDVKVSEILCGVFIFHLTWSVLPHYLVKCRSPKFAVNYGKFWDNHFLSHDQVIRWTQQVGLLVTSSYPVFDPKFSVKTSRTAEV